MRRVTTASAAAHPELQAPFITPGSVTAGESDKHGAHKQTLKSPFSLYFHFN